MRKAVAFMLIVILCAPFALAQELPLVLNHDIDFMKVGVPNKIDSLDLARYLNKLKLKLIEKGHFAATTSFQKSPETWIASVGAGPKYAGGRFEITGSSADMPTKTVEDLTELQEYLDQQLSDLANRGYPLATLSFDAVKVQEGVFSGRINLKKGSLIHFDTLEVFGFNKIDTKTLSSLTQIRPGEKYSEMRVHNIAASLGSIPFVKLVERPTITFKENKCIVILTLEKRSSSSADGLIGILNNQQEKPTVVGHINLDLNNILGKAAGVKLEWARLQPQTQNLVINISTAVLFGNPLGVNSSFKLYKQDTNFLNYNFRFGLSKRLKGNAWATVFSERTASQTIVEQPSDTEVSDLKIDYVGFGVHGSGAETSERDKYLYMNTEIAFGRKLSSGENSSKLKIEHVLNWSIPLWKNFVINWSLSSSLMLNQSLKTNELFRVGGIGQLRGFNPNSFYTNYFHLSNLELRYYANSKSHFYLFYDQGLLRQKHQAHLIIPAGAGLGASLGLDAGILSLTYAVGFFKGGEHDLSNPKFYINYRALF